jgi:hypothetical protein
VRGGTAKYGFRRYTALNFSTLHLSPDDQHLMTGGERVSTGATAASSLYSGIFSRDEGAGATIATEESKQSDGINSSDSKAVASLVDGPEPAAKPQGTI